MEPILMGNYIFFMETKTHELEIHYTKIVGRVYTNKKLHVQPWNRK